MIFDFRLLETIFALEAIRFLGIFMRANQGTPKKMMEPSKTTL